MYSASAEEKVKDKVQDSPKKSGSDAVLNADVKKPTDEEITTPKSVIIDALVKTTDLLASATVSTLTVETTTKDEDDDDDDYAQPEEDNGALGSCVGLSLCGWK